MRRSLIPILIIVFAFVAAPPILRELFSAKLPVAEFVVHHSTRALTDFTFSQGSSRNLSLEDFRVISENWSGVLAPARTPSPIISKLNAAFTAAVNDPDVSQQLAQFGITAFTGTPAEFGQIIQTEIARWGGIIRKMNINHR